MSHCAWAEKITWPGTYYFSPTALCNIRKILQTAKKVKPVNYFRKMADTDPVVDPTVDDEIEEDIPEPVND